MPARSGDVELGGALIIELPDGKLVRQRTRPPPEPQGGNAAPGPNNASRLYAPARLAAVKPTVCRTSITSITSKLA